MDYWEAEVARSENAEGIAGSAARLSYERRTERESLSFEAVHSGRDFEAEGSLARAGTVTNFPKKNSLLAGALPLSTANKTVARSIRRIRADR